MFLCFSSQFHVLPICYSNNNLESPLDIKEIKPVNPKGTQSWIFIGRNDAEAETPKLWPPHAKSWLTGKDPDTGRDWGAGGEGDDRGWDGWMASSTQWMWVWVNSGSWWWTERPGVLRFMGSKRVGHDWATELNWTEALNHDKKICKIGVFVFCFLMINTILVNIYWSTYYVLRVFSALFYLAFYVTL